MAGKGNTLRTTRARKLPCTALSSQSAAICWTFACHFCLLPCVLLHGRSMPYCAGLKVLLLLTCSRLLTAYWHLSSTRQTRLRGSRLPHYKTGVSRPRPAPQPKTKDKERIPHGDHHPSMLNQMHSSGARVARLSLYAVST